MKQSFDFRRFANRDNNILQLLIITAVIFAVMSFLEPTKFLRYYNFESISFVFPELGILAIAMMGIGVTHFATPEPFVRIVPAWLPAPLVLLVFLVPFLIVEPLLVVATVAIAAWEGDIDRERAHAVLDGAVAADDEGDVAVVPLSAAAH